MQIHWIPGSTDLRSSLLWKVLAMRARTWLRVSSWFPSSLCSAPSLPADISVSNLISGLCVSFPSVSEFLKSEHVWSIFGFPSPNMAPDIHQMPRKSRSEFPPEFTVRGHPERGEGVYLRFLRAVESRVGTVVEDTDVVQNGGTRGRGEEAMSRKPRNESDAGAGTDLGKGGRPWARGAARWGYPERLCAWFPGGLRAGGGGGGHSCGPFFSQVGKKERSYSSLTLEKRSPTLSLYWFHTNPPRLVNCPHVINESSWSSEISY